MAAEAALSYISGDRARWIRQFQQEMAEMDIKSSFDAVAHKNWTEGSLKKALDLAKKFMALGHSKEEAAEFAEIDVKLLD